MEELQVELREAKAALALAQTDEDPELARLREAVAEAGRRRARALTRRQMLEAEHDALEQEIEQLKLDMRDQKSLTRGSWLRYENDDWSNPKLRGGAPLVFTLMFAAWLAIMAVTFVVQSCGR